MESNGEDTTAAISSTLPGPTHLLEGVTTRSSPPLQGASADPNPDPQFSNMAADRRSPSPKDLGLIVSLDTPIHAPFANHFNHSNIRGHVEDVELKPMMHGPISSPTSHDAKNAASILANGHHEEDSAQTPLQPYAKLDDAISNSRSQDDGGTNLDEDEYRDPMQAYAKLTMPDGDYYVTSLKVIVGRDMDYWKRYIREKKRAEKAQQALDEYALEPSQPSQPDEAEKYGISSSKSSQSLVGRPAGALPSNYSEQGGAVSYPAHSDDEEYTRPSRRRRRKTLKSTASSISVAPASLHPNILDFSASNPFGADVGGMAFDNPGFVGIHPANRDDIRLISKEHLRFEYNFEEERWQLHILGNRAFLNNELQQRGVTVFLDHDDEIIVTSVSIRFRLPENRNSPGPSRGTFADSIDAGDDDLEEDPETSFTTSPSQRVTIFDDESDDENVRSTLQKPPKLKLSFKKKGSRRESVTEREKPAKISLKQKKTEEDELKKVEKGKTPKTASKQRNSEPSPDGDEEQNLRGVESNVSRENEDEALKLEPGEASPPAATSVAPPVIEPGSIFEGVAAEELPQKRKGPGRPPKNGLISKRDQSFVKRKLKEYEKRGQAPPPMDELVAIVRAENKAKELAAKAAARGEIMPDLSVMPSIEMDNLRTGAETTGDTERLLNATEATRKSSPRPKRVIKSPSPMKPESEYTEDDMKKPTVTYVHILDEVLRDHPTGKADLQEIYDRICKRYPYFKYRVNTAGWQSSVRHNLLQHDRFVENGRSGKGRLWTINYECPIDKEKKRRVTPPPRPTIPTQVQSTGLGPPVAYNNPALHASNYHTPYPPPSAGYGPNAQVMQQVSPAAPQTQQHAARPHQSPAASSFQHIVTRIMGYRTQYLAQFPPNSEIFKEHDALFSRMTNFISDMHAGTTAAVELHSSEERKVFDALESIVKNETTPPSGGPARAQVHQPQDMPASTSEPVTAGVNEGPLAIHSQPQRVEAKALDSGAGASETTQTTLEAEKQDPRGGVLADNRAKESEAETLLQPPVEDMVMSAKLPEGEVQPNTHRNPVHEEPETLKPSLKRSAEDSSVMDDTKRIRTE